jgi:hypothetical protein
LIAVEPTKTLVRTVDFDPRRMWSLSILPFAASHGLA